MDFSRKSNKDEFSRKLNGEWIFLGSKRGLKRNNNNMIRLVPARIESGRGRFSRKSNEHGFSQKSNEDEFSRKLNGAWIFLGIKRRLKKNNNNMIRLVPVRIESGRVREGLF